MCRWLSTMKYFSPLCSYIGELPLAHRLEVEADVLSRVLGIGEHDDPVVEDDHAPVVGRHDLLEVVVAEIIPPECLGALCIVDLELADPIDANHRWHLLDGDVLLAAHDLGHDVADLVVHERDARAVGGGPVDGEATVGGAHRSRSFPSRLSSPSTSAKRARECSSDCSNRITFSPGCDQIGCSARPAAMERGVHSLSHPCIVARFCSPNVSSWASMPNRPR